MMNRTMWTSLTLALILAVITACSSNDNNNNEDQSADVEVNEEGYPIVDEELTMTMIAPGMGRSPNWYELDVLEEYVEKTNINFKYNTPPDDEFETNVMLTYYRVNIDDIIVDYDEQVILLPIEDLIDEYAHNIKKIFEENPEIEKSVTTTDGHIYAIPRISTSHRAIWKSPMWYNGDWLDELDVKELPET